MLAQRKAIWQAYRGKLQPNRKTGAQLLAYLQQNYVLTELFEQQVLDVITHNVTMNPFYAEKCKAGAKPIPRAFFVENEGKSSRFYHAENSDAPEVWGGVVTKILVGLDLTSGFYQVEGSTLLWDELCALQGLDDADLQNFILVSEYIACLKRLGQA